MREPKDPLDPIRTAWRGLAAPPAGRELANEDPATRAVVDWLQHAYARATPAPVPVPRLKRSVASRRLAAAAALLLAAGAVARWAEVPDVTRIETPAAGRLEPRVLFTSADRTVMTAGVVRLTLLNPPPPEKDQR